MFPNLIVVDTCKQNEYIFRIQGVSRKNIDISKQISPDLSLDLHTERPKLMFVNLIAHD